jgi:hypothetical protein
MSHYVYIWYKPDGTPFYVGIGKTAIRWNPNRPWGQRNRFCRAVLNKYGRENILFSVFGVASLYSAYRYERALINRIGRADLGLGTLTNMTAGGEGSTELGDSARKVLRDKWAANTARKQQLSTQSRSTKNKERALRRAADPNDAFAKSGASACRLINSSEKLTQKRIDALRLSSDAISKGVIASMETRLKTMRTPEVQAKLKAPKTAEHKAKISAAKKEYWAKRKGITTQPA